MQYLSFKQQDFNDAISNPTDPDAYITMTKEIKTVREALLGGYKLIAVLDFTGYVVLGRERV